MLLDVSNLSCMILHGTHESYLANRNDGCLIIDGKCHPISRLETSSFFYRVI